MAKICCRCGGPLDNRAGCASESCQRPPFEMKVKGMVFVANCDIPKGAVIEEEWLNEIPVLEMSPLNLRFYICSRTMAVGHKAKRLIRARCLLSPDDIEIDEAATVLHSRTEESVFYEVFWRYTKVMSDSQKALMPNLYSPPPFSSPEITADRARRAVKDMDAACLRGFITDLEQTAQGLGFEPKEIKSLIQRLNDAMDNDAR